MSKKIKRIGALLLAFLILPIGIQAQDVDVTVNITNVPVIEVVTTISSDFNINVTEEVSNQSYISVENNSATPISVEISDIEAVTPGAPSTFLDYREANLSSAGTTDTNTKIAFAISENGETYHPILTDEQMATNIDLGVLGPDDWWGTTEYTLGEKVFNSNEFQSAVYGTNLNVYDLFVRTGYAWTTTHTFQYKITMVVGLSEESIGYTNPANTSETYGITRADITIGKSATETAIIASVYYDSESTPITETITEPGVSNNKYYDLGIIGNLYAGTKLTPVTEVLEDGTTKVEYAIVYPKATFESDTPKDFYLPVYFSVGTYDGDGNTAEETVFKIADILVVDNTLE